MSGNVIKGSFLEKRGKFLREMIDLLYRFSKVAGLTCKLDNSVINCGGFPVNVLLFIFKITIFGKPVNMFLSQPKRPFGGVLKKSYSEPFDKILGQAYF